MSLARTQAEVVHRNADSLPGRAQRELIVAGSDFDAARMSIYLGEYEGALEYLVNAEGWLAAADADTARISRYDSRTAFTLTSVANTTRGYINLLEGKQSAAQENLRTVQHIEPAKAVYSYIVQRAGVTPTATVNPAALIAMAKTAYRNRPVMSEAQVKMMQGVVFALTKVLRNGVVSAVGVAVGWGLENLTQRPSPPPS